MRHTLCLRSLPERRERAAEPRQAPGPASRDVKRVRKHMSILMFIISIVIVIIITIFIIIIIIIIVIIVIIVELQA